MTKFSMYIYFYVISIFWWCWCFQNWLASLLLRTFSFHHHLVNSSNNSSNCKWILFLHKLICHEYRKIFTDNDENESGSKTLKISSRFPFQDIVKNIILLILLLLHVFTIHIMNNTRCCVVLTFFLLIHIHKINIKTKHSCNLFFRRVQDRAY